MRCTLGSATQTSTSVRGRPRNGGTPSWHRTRARRSSCTTGRGRTLRSGSGWDVIGYVEPKPGIPPSPGHTLELMREMKRQNVKIIAVEPYFDLKTPNAVARDTGATVLVSSPSVGGVKEASTYIGVFDYNINLPVSAIKQTGTGQ